ncbi:hypothetical protein F5X96DRAFT_666572 [Biscogniauxia mediterranea]|nr:hypothetical protein F5X96DRAFT_666572 [Biscogniauxia mediterranea]
MRWLPRVRAIGVRYVLGVHYKRRETRKAKHKTRVADSGITNPYHGPAVQIRERSHWYTTQRVVIRRRNGRIQLSRRGSRPSYALQSGFVSIDGEIIQHDGFILIDDGDDPGSFLL